MTAVPATDAPDASQGFGFSMIASAVAALPAVLMSIGAAVALYLYSSPRFLRDATLRLIQAVAKGKTDVVGQLGNLAGTLAAPTTDGTDSKDSARAARLCSKPPPHL
jgi:hypothetical protein